MRKDSGFLGVRWSRAAVVAVLAATGIAAPFGAMPALAADGEVGSVRVDTSQPVGDVTYKAWQIFVADLDETGKARYLTWATPAVEAAVKGVIAAKDDTLDVSTMSERDCLDFIETNWGESSDTRVAGVGDFALDLANAVWSLPVSATLPANTATNIAEGWWLVATDPTSIGAAPDAGVGESGTAPIFLKSNKDVPVVVTEKTSMPRVTKEVKDDDAVTSPAVEEHYEMLEPGLGDINPNDYFVFDEQAYAYVPYSSDLVHGETSHYHLFEDDAYGQWKGQIALYRHVPAEAANDGYGNVADANKDQPLDFRIVGTLPSSLASYDAFPYSFEDTMSGLEMGTDDLANLRVSVNGITVSSDSYTKSFANGMLIVSFDDIKAIKDANGNDIEVDASDSVMVEYKAHLTGDAVTGSAANPNTVSLKYRSAPNSDGLATTSTTQVKTYSYGIDLVKKTLDKTSALPGMKFTLKDTATDLYVQSDGSLGDTAHEFETDANGATSLMRLDTGTYVMHETQAPVVGNDHYAAWTNDLTLTIAARYDASGELVPDSFDVSLSGGDEGNANSVDALNSTTGIANVTVTDDLKLGMPVTGEAGTLLLSAAGIAIVAVSLWSLRDRGEKAAV